MSDTIETRTVRMGVSDYRALAEECRQSAVAMIDDKSDPWARSGRLKIAADLLRAADTYEGRANIMENFGMEPDSVELEVYG